MEDARLVYLNTLEALRSAASEMRSKKKEYLQVLEQERLDLEQEIGRVKELNEETWPVGPTPDAANEVRSFPIDSGFGWALGIGAFTTSCLELGSSECSFPWEKGSGSS